MHVEMRYWMFFPDPKVTMAEKDFCLIALTVVKLKFHLLGTAQFNLRTNSDGVRSIEIDNMEELRKLGKALEELFKSKCPNPEKLNVW